MRHICVSKLTIIGSDNGLSPSRRQAIIWTNGGILLIRNLGTNFSETLSEIYTFSFKKICLKMASGRRRPFFLGLNVLILVPGKMVNCFHCHPAVCTVCKWWKYYDPKVIFNYWHTTRSHFHHGAKLFESIGHMKCLWGIFCQGCV